MDTSSKPISLSQIVLDARYEGDMEVSETEIVECLNRCISTINVSLGTKLPPVDMTLWMTNYANTDGYEYFVCDDNVANDILMRNVIYPYVIYDFKRKAEQFEYANLMYGNFGSGLSLFRAKYLSHLKPDFRKVLNETDNYVSASPAPSFFFSKRRY